MPALATSWDVSPDGADLHLPPAPRRHVHRRHALRRPPGAARAGSACSTPRCKGGRGWPLYPITRRQGIRRRQGDDDRRARRAERLHASSSRSRSRSRSSRSCSPCRSPRSRRSSVAAELRRASRSAPGRGSSSSGSTTTTCCSRGTRSTGAARRKADSLKARIIAEPSTAVAEFESGNVDVLQIPAGRDRATGRRTTERRKLLASTPSLELVYVAINTTRGPLTDVRVRQALNYAIDRSASSTQSHRRSRRARRRRRSRRRCRRRHDAHGVPVRHRARRSQLLREAGYPNGIDVELWTSHESDLRPHRRDAAGVPRAVGHSREDRAARERRRARGGAQGTDGSVREGLVRRLS